MDTRAYRSNCRVLFSEAIREGWRVNNTYIYNHRVSVHEIDAFGLWRPDAILRLMQYVAGLHSQALGYSRDKLIKEYKTVWMLSSIAVKFIKYPGFDEEVELETWYGQPERVLLALTP